MTAPGTREVPHGQEACYGSRLHCAWHQVDEPGQGACQTCLECGHAYMTEADLIAAWNAEWGQCGHDREPGELPPGCAFCGHDW